MKIRTLSVLALTLLGVVSACGEPSPSTPRPSGAPSQGNPSVANVAISDDALASLNFAQALRDAGSSGTAAPFCLDELKDGHRVLRKVNGELGDRTRYAVSIGFRPDAGTPTTAFVHRTLAGGGQVNAMLTGDSVQLTEVAPRAQGGGAAQHWAGADSPAARAAIAVRDAAAQLPTCNSRANATTALPQQS